MNKIKNIDEILKACKKDKRDAQSQLYKLFYGEMMALCMRYVANQEEALEVLNDGFMKVFKALRKEIPSKSIRGWIRRIMINTAIDHYRANKKHYYAMDIEHSNLESYDENILDIMAADEILELVQQLPNSYRMVFNLHVVEGYTHPQIGKILGITDGTSRSNFAKARLKLQKMVKQLNYKLYKHYAG